MQQNQLTPIVAQNILCKNIKKISGPKGLPFLGNISLLKHKRMHRKFMEWADQYGPVYQFKLAQKSFIVVSETETINGILRRRPDVFRRMGPIESVFEEIYAAGVFSAEGDAWRRQRKLVMPAFQNQNLKEFFGTLEKITERLKNRWEIISSTNNDINVIKELTRYTVDVTTSLAFNYDINTIENNGDIIQRHLEKIFPIVGKRLNAPFPYWRYFKLPQDRAVDRALANIQKKIDEIILLSRERLSNNPELKQRPSNLLEALLAARDQDGSHLTDKEVLGNMYTILLAGEDTTANVMAWTMYHMLKNPEVQQKMQEEAVRVLGKETQLQSYADTERLPYIEGAIMEAMRLHSVAPFLYLEANEDFDLNGMFISKGTNLIALTGYAPLQDAHFTLPERFYPERWINSLRPESWKHNMKAFMPFGNGPRLCPGKSLAMLEMKMVFSMLCRNFSIVKPRNNKVAEERLALVATPINLWANLQKNSGIAKV